jgi:hypothetical protein
LSLFPSSLNVGIEVVMARDLPEPGEDIQQWLDARDKAQSERMRQLLLSEGRPDLVAELDAKIKDIRLGLAQARSCWSALSAPQREALVYLSKHKQLVRHLPGVYGRTEGLGSGLPRFRLATVRNLIARQLVDLEGGAFDPERRVVISDRGRFVVQRGPK